MGSMCHQDIQKWSAYPYTTKRVNSQCWQHSLQERVQVKVSHALVQDSQGNLRQLGLSAVVGTPWVAHSHNLDAIIPCEHLHEMRAQERL